MNGKFKASGIHLLFSFMLISLCVGFVVIHFYTLLIYHIEDTIQGIKILIPVDIILGPILTWVIYKKGKKGLRFDLITIIILQISAMIYGCWVLYSARPSYIVFYGKSFYVAPTKIDQSGIVDKNLTVGTFSSPQFVFTNIPGTREDKMNLAMASINMGIPIQWEAKYFSAFDRIETDELIKASLPIPKLLEHIDQADQKKLKKLIATPNKYVFIETIGTKYRKVVAVNLDTKKPEAVLNFAPRK